MDQPNCSLNIVPVSSLPIHDLVPDILTLEKFLTVPAVWSPKMSEDNWEKEVDGMLNRALLTRQFASGAISYEDFLDGLADTGVYVYDVVDWWDKGCSFSQDFIHTGVFENGL